MRGSSVGRSHLENVARCHATLGRALGSLCGMDAASVSARTEEMGRKDGEMGVGAVSSLRGCAFGKSACIEGLVERFERFLCAGIFASQDILVVDDLVGGFATMAGEPAELVREAVPVVELRRGRTADFGHGIVEMQVGSTESPLRREDGEYHGDKRSLDTFDTGATRARRDGRSVAHLYFLQML